MTTHEKTIPTVQVIPLSLLDEDPGQPRQEFPEQAQQELLASMGEMGGVQHPIMVVALPTGRYRIEDGARRFRAAQELQLTELPCMVVEPHSFLETRIRQISAGRQQQTLTPLEEAQGVYIALLAAQVEALENEQNLSHEVTDGLLNDGDSPTAQIDVLIDRICTLANVDDIDAYFASGNVRVARKNVLGRMGYADVSPAHIKRILKPIKLATKVQDALADTFVSSRTLNRLAQHDPDEQEALLTAAKQAAAETNGDVGETLRDVLERDEAENGQAAIESDQATWNETEGSELPDEPASHNADGSGIVSIAPETQDTFEPDPSLALPSGPAGSAAGMRVDGGEPDRGSTPPDGHGAVWSPDDFLVLTGALETAADICHQSGAAQLTDAQRTEAQALANDVIVSLRRAGLEL